MEKLRAYLKDNPVFVISVAIGVIGLTMSVMSDISEMQAAGGALMMVAGISIPLSMIVSLRRP